MHVEAHGVAGIEIGKFSRADMILCDAPTSGGPFMTDSGSRVRKPIGRGTTQRINETKPPPA